MPPSIQCTGFTILEALIAIAIMGILLGLGVPAFNETIRSNRAANQTNELVTALNTARSEASKRGLPVTVCAAVDAAQTACAAATASNWVNGWITFTDSVAPNGSISTGDVIVLKSPGVTGGMQVTSNSLGYVRFGPSGGSTDSNNVAFTVRHSTCTGKNLRTVALNGTGRVSLTKTDCP